LFERNRLDSAERDNLLDIYPTPVRTVFLDLETTCLDPRTDEIHEIRRPGRPLGDLCRSSTGTWSAIIDT